jgi:hypothetical protein
MNGVLALVAATVVSIDIGWQPRPDGGFEYIIQIEPQMLDTLKDGQAIGSELPANLRGMRSYKITVGNAKLPHEGEPAPFTPVPVDEPPAAPAAAGPTGTVARSLPGPGPDLSPPPGDARPQGGANTQSTAEVTPPPALEPDPSPQEMTPRMAGYMESPAAAHAGAANSSGDEAGTGSNVERAKKGFAFSGARPSIGHEPNANSDSTGKVSPVKVPPPPVEEKRDPNASHDLVASGTPADAVTSVPPKGTGGAGSSAPPAPTESKPWLPLVGTVLALFGSLGANLYLGWNTLELRSRYRALAAQLHVG